MGSGSPPQAASYCSRFQANAPANAALRACSSRTMGYENDGSARYTSSPGCSTGSGLRTSAFSSEKAIVAEPMPTTSAATAATETSGRRTISRHASRTSCRIASRRGGTQTARAVSRMRNSFPIARLTVASASSDGREPARHQLLRLHRAVKRHFFGDVRIEPAVANAIPKPSEYVKHGFLPRALRRSAARDEWR